MKRSLPAVLLIPVLLLTACGGKSTAVVPTADENGGGESPAVPTDTPQAESGILPADPQEITFQAADGQELTGRYYPAAGHPSPVVVLMHWMGGDMNDWNEVAPWLQNRGLTNPFPNPGDDSWWDPTWFPPVPESRSYGIFTFSFRGCKPMNEGGCSGINEAGWLLDAQAAMMKATELDGVDPNRVAAMGSSIGADGAIDGCAFLNEQKPGSCQGALSLSPGGYLTIPYKNAVKNLGESQPQVAAWCLGDEREIGICNTAADEGNAAFQAHEIPGGQHGNMLLRPELEPLPMQLILEFLLQTVSQ
jgi:hypothetical protein